MGKKYLYGASRIRRYFGLIREDVRVFRRVHGGGILPFLYYPMFSAVVLFRMAGFFYGCKLTRPISYFLVRMNDFLHGIWIGPRVTAGPGLFLGHARGLVVNPDTVLGSYVSIMQHVTLGGPGVVVGDWVEINAGATIVASKRRQDGLEIGDRVVIGAGAVVVKSVPARAVVVGNPCRIIGYSE
jgi:serine O-acetyltransferase